MKMYITDAVERTHVTRLLCRQNTIEKALRSKCISDRILLLFTKGVFLTLSDEW